MTRIEGALFLLVVVLFGCTNTHDAPGLADGGTDRPRESGAPARDCVSIFAADLSIDGGGPAVSFRGDLIPLFGMRCTFGGCHEGRETTGQLSLGDQCTYDPRRGVCSLGPDSMTPEVAEIVHGNLVSQSNAAANLKRAEPYRPDRSFMLYKLSGCQNAFPDRTGCTQCGDPMPPPLDPLRESAPEVFATIARWIAQGAKLD